MKGQVFCILLVVSYSCIAEYCRLSCFNKKDACSQSWKPDVCELAWAGCFLLWPVSSVYQWVVPPPYSNGLYSVCVQVLIYSSYIGALAKLDQDSPVRPCFNVITFFPNMFPNIVTLKEIEAQDFSIWTWRKSQFRVEHSCDTVTLKTHSTLEYIRGSDQSGCKYIIYLCLQQTYLIIFHNIH